MVGFFPPSSSTTGVKFFAAAAMTILATVVPPVKKMWSHCCSSSAVVSGLAPRTTEKASRSRYSGRSRAITSAVAGATSEGLTTAAFPPAIAAIIRIPESLCPLPYILSIADTLDLISVEAHGA